VLPPVGVERPDFAHLAQQAKANAKPNEWFTIPEQELAIGLDDSNENVLPRSSFGWDNEKPQRTVAVHSFEAQARPITNGEYAKYLQINQIQTRPASWTQISQNGGLSQNGNGSATDEFLDKYAIRTVFGPVPLRLAEDWPLMASYDELAGYAEWTKCRIPTLDEVKSIYQHSAQLNGRDSRPTTFV
jgi:formylglycine-generating enzyme required for sulfatase activity